MSGSSGSRGSRGTCGSRGSRGTCGSRGPRERIPFHGDRSSIRESLAQSPTSSDGTVTRILTSGSRSTRGSHGGIPIHGDRSSIRESRAQSPTTSDGTTVRLYTSGGRRMYRGADGRSIAAGSTSRGGAGDPMGDMQGVLREYSYHQPMQKPVDHEDDDSDHEFSDDGGDDGDGIGDDIGDDIGDEDQHDSIYANDSSQASQRPFITRIGETFASNEIHKSIYRLLREHLTGPWITYKMVPQKIVVAMYKRFKTRWNWEPKNEQLIYEAFVFMLKRRYRDIMASLRKKSVSYANKAGRNIKIGDPEVFKIIRNFPPDLIAGNVWGQMCAIWSSEAWRLKSLKGKNNRNREDRGGKSSRHTGGSIGYDERRIRLRMKLNKEPTFLEVFLDTHLTKESKKRFWAGELNVKIPEGLKFCTERAKQAYGAYLKEMTKEYGLNFTRDDADTWARLHGNGNKRRVFGIGSSDLNFVVTGTQIAPSSVDSQSQNRLQDLEARLEAEKKAREELEKKLQKMNDFLEKFNPPGKE